MQNCYELRQPGYELLNRSNLDLLGSLSEVDAGNQAEKTLRREAPLQGFVKYIRREQNLSKKRTSEAISL